MCNRIAKRMECYECGYPYSEAMYPTDFSMRHDIFCCPGHGYDYLTRTKTELKCSKCDFNIVFAQLVK